jgi:hypothetical protein
MLVLAPLTRSNHRLSHSTVLNFVKQTLTVKPLQVLLIPPRSSIIAGKRIEFKCQSVGSRPKPRITWFKGTANSDQPIITLNEVLESHSSDSNTTISTVSFIPDISDNGKHLSCRSENPVIPGSALEEGIRLHVTCESHLHEWMRKIIHPGEACIRFVSSVLPESVSEFFLFHFPPPHHPPLF